MPLKQYTVDIGQGITVLMVASSEAAAKEQVFTKVKLFTMRYADNPVSILHDIKRGSVRELEPMTQEELGSLQDYMTARGITL